MLRVVMISPLPPERAGEAPYTEALIRGLAARGVRIFAIAGPGARTDGYPENVRVFPVWRGDDVLYPLRLARLIKRLRPHIVHVQFGPDRRIYGGMFGEVMFLLLLLLKLMGIRTTLTSHSTWMPEQVAERISTYRLIGRLSVLAPALFRLYVKVMDLVTDTIQLSTARLGSTLRTRFLREYGVAPEKVLEIPHPCKNEELTVSPDEVRQRTGTTGREVVLSFGFIRPGKGLEVAIRAIERVRYRVDNVLLLIAGTPVDRAGRMYLEELKTLVREKQLGRWVRFDTMFVPEERVPDYFASASVILLPYQESVGVSGPAHNFASYGIPIVAADVGLHMRESLGGSLVLFRMGSPDDLARALIELLISSKSRENVSRRLRDYARQETVDLAVERTLQYYRVTLQRDRGRQMTGRR